ncbi:hypothetical protein BJV74DRAFT_864928 [Russula compacta]|nr:hypothetical protein BJV74DRAFT_864928 [Russula compacta]
MYWPGSARTMPIHHLRCTIYSSIPRCAWIFCDVIALLPAAISDARERRVIFEFGHGIPVRWRPKSGPSCFTSCSLGCISPLWLLFTPSMITLSQIYRRPSAFGRWAFLTVSLHSNDQGP